MRTIRIGTFVFLLSLVVFSFICFSHGQVTSEQKQAPQIAVGVHIAREPGTPIQAAYSHCLRFRILNITPVEKTANRNILQLKVQPWYGKIEKHDYDLHKKYDTQELTILFPAALDATVKIGDIVNYRIEGYNALDTQPAHADDGSTHAR